MEVFQYTPFARVLVKIISRFHHPLLHRLLKSPFLASDHRTAAGLDVVNSALDSRTWSRLLIWNTSEVLL
jgi:hypothetical protein